MSDELFKGLDRLQQGVQQFTTARAIGEAQNQIQEMQGLEMNDIKRRAALGQIGNNLALELGKLGAPISQIQSAVGSIKPEVIRNSVDAHAQGLTDYAKDLQKFEQAPNIENREDNQGFQSAMQDKKFQQALMLQGMKNQSAGKAKMSKGDVEFETNVKVALSEASKLKKLVAGDPDTGKDGFGSFELFDQKASADLTSIQYQLALNYAKIVDPESVVREGESAAAQKYMIPLGLFTRNKTATRAIDEYMRRVQLYRKTRNDLKSDTSKGSPDGQPVEDNMDIVDWE